MHINTDVLYRKSAHDAIGIIAQGEECFFVQYVQKNKFYRYFIISAAQVARKTLLYHDYSAPSAQREHGEGYTRIFVLINGTA